MYANGHPTLTKEDILDIRLAPKSTAPQRNNATPTKWQILPAPRRYLESRWHLVYSGPYKHPFIEAYDGSRVLVTARLEALYAERADVRPSENRYLTRGEVQDIVSDKVDHDGVAIGKVARRGMNAYRIPTAWRVWFNPHGNVNNTTSAIYWHRVYATMEGSWLYIEVGGEHLRLEAHKQLLGGRAGSERKRGAFGRIKIDRAAFLSWLRPDGEVIRENED